VKASLKALFTDRETTIPAMLDARRKTAAMDAKIAAAMVAERRDADWCLARTHSPGARNKARDEKM
jgi:hypothetical protein